MHHRQKETLFQGSRRAITLVLHPADFPTLSQHCPKSLLPASCFLCSIYHHLPQRYPLASPTSAKLEPYLQGPLEMPHSSVTLPRFPYLNVFPAPTLSPTPGTPSGLAALGFLGYSSSWTITTPRTVPRLAQNPGGLPWEGMEITHLLRESTGGMQLCTPRCDKPQAGVSRVPQRTSSGGQGRSYRSKQA